MTIFAEVVKGLYTKEKIKSEKVYELLQNKKITREEYLEILGKEKDE